MAIADSKSVQGEADDGPRLALADLVLLRIASGGATRAQLQKDLSSLVAPKISGTAFRRAAELAIGQFNAQNIILEAKGRLSLTATGLRNAQSLLGWDNVGDAPWLEVRNGPLNVEPQPNGPLLVTGNLEIVSGTGRTVNKVTKTWLCRCGQSKNKPYCDSSHKAAGFVAD